MSRILVGTATAVALTFLSMPAAAAPKAKAGAKLTQNDLRVCMGVDGSKPEDQIPVCTKIINSGLVKHPHTGDYYATRGAAYFAVGQLDNAIADLNKAIGIRPAPEFYFQRGMVFMSLSDLSGAKTDFDQVIKLKPAFAPPYFMRGLVAYSSADFAEAQSFFDAAVKRVPTHYKALYGRGVIKKKLGDESGGKKDMSDARGMSDSVEKEMAQLGIKP
ncbi:MAG: tetratricopeptide repeat protein [Micropepsaceae bacterium]